MSREQLLTRHPNSSYFRQGRATRTRALIDADHTNGQSRQAPAHGVRDFIDLDSKSRTSGSPQSGYSRTACRLSANLKRCDRNLAASVIDVHNERFGMKTFRPATCDVLCGRLREMWLER